MLNNWVENFKNFKKIKITSFLCLRKLLCRSRYEIKKNDSLEVPRWNWNTIIPMLSENKLASKQTTLCGT